MKSQRRKRHDVWTNSHRKSPTSGRSKKFRKWAQGESLGARDTSCFKAPCIHFNGGHEPLSGPHALLIKNTRFSGNQLLHF